MPKISVLQFHNYHVEELYFENHPLKEEKNEYELFPHFDREFIDLGNDNYDVKLSIEIVPTEEHPMPFHLRVIIVGHFTYCDHGEKVNSDIKNQILHKNTVSILFPFLRQIVASLTSNANVATLMLPIMNFNDGFFEKDTSE